MKLEKDEGKYIEHTSELLFHLSFSDIKLKSTNLVFGQKVELFFLKSQQISPAELAYVTYFYVLLRTYTQKQTERDQRTKSKASFTKTNQMREFLQLIIKTKTLVRN